MKKGFYLSGLMALCFVFSSVVVSAAVPTVRTDPHDTTACTGGLVTFAITATDTPAALTINYEWQESTDGTTWTTLTDGGFYSGTTNDTLTVAADPSLDGRWYRAIATNTAGADTSGHGVLTVLAYPDAGTITGSAAEICKGSSVLLSDEIAGGTWASSNTAVATVTAGGTVHAAAQGFVTITYRVSNGFCSSTALFAMRVDTVVTALPITGATSVCRGGTLTLMNANNLYGTGTWSSSNTSATVSPAGVVTGTAYGPVTITYDFTNGCNSVSSTHSVQVDTVLNAGVISGPSAVCVSNTIHLSETAAGGMWISGSTGVANVDAAGNVTGVGQGTALISYYMANACGASVATYSVTVSSPAGAISGDDSVGVGGTHVLTNTAAGGLWSSANVAIAVVNSTTGVVTGIAVGATTISYTVTNACGTTIATLPYFVGLAPGAGSITGRDSVCTGATITLSNSVGGGEWSASNTNGTISDAGVVTGVSRGLDTFYYTVTNGFGTARARKIVFINSAPVVTLTGPSVIGIGGNYFFNATPTGGTYSNSNPAMGVFVTTYTAGGFTTGSYVVMGRGTDVIRYRVTNTCGTTDSFFTVFLAPLGVNSIDDATAELSVYPNPTQGDFTLSLASALTEDAVVTVTNMVGSKVKELTVSTNTKANISLDQPAGIYFLTAVTAHGRYTTKITVAK